MVPILSHLLRFSALFLATSHVAHSAPPNIIVIMADDLGWMDVNVFAERGSGVSAASQFYETPHINQLAADGVAFSRCYSSALCTPSRASLLSGRNSAAFGMNNAFDMASEKNFENSGKACPPGYLPLDSLHLASPLYPLRTAAYSTALPPAQAVEDGAAMKLLPAFLPEHRSAFLGKWHLGGHNRAGHKPDDYGFESIAYEDQGWSGFEAGARKAWHKPGPETKAGYLTDALTEMSSAWIRDHVAQKPRQPFFLYLAHFAVHTPLQARSPEDVRHFQNKKSKGWNDQNNATYAAMIRALDDSVGAIRKMLSDLALTENTVILFLSDNGGKLREKDTLITSNKPLRGHKAQTWEGGIRVPMIAAWPKQWKPGRWVDTPIALTHIAASLVDINGSRKVVTDSLNEPSFLPLLEGRANAYQAQPIFIHEPHYRSSELPVSGGSVMTPNTVMIDGAYKLIANHDGVNCLYDITKDISESNDLTKVEPERVRAMLEKIAAWRFTSIPARYDTSLNGGYNPKLPAALPPLAQPAFIRP